MKRINVWPPPEYFRMFLLLAAAVLVSLLANSGGARAAYETGTYQIRSPLATTKYVTSPARYHDGSELGCPVDNYDSPSFDNPSTCRAAIYPVGGDAPDWALDIAGSPGNGVYIDVNPLGQEGAPAGSTYRVVAGDIYQWDSSSNGKYQYFGLHTWNPNSSSWENYAWIRIGHFNPTYTTPGTVIIASTTVRGVVNVGSVASAGTWPAHVHIDFYNYSGWSRSYEWDGPSNANDTTLGPACIYAGGSASNCNAQLRSTDGMGYVGGTKTFFAEIGNPYYVEF